MLLYQIQFFNNLIGHLVFEIVSSVTQSILTK